MKKYVVVLRHYDEGRNATPTRDALDYVSLDRRHMMSVYDTDDVEAVRSRQSEPFQAAFSCGTWREMLGLDRSGPVGDRSIVIIERHFDPTPIEQLLERARSEFSPCFNANNIDLIDSYMPIPNDGTNGGVCVYAAPDADTARRANRTVNFPFIRVWPAKQHPPE